MLHTSAEAQVVVHVRECTNNWRLNHVGKEAATRSCCAIDSFPAITAVKTNPHSMFLLGVHWTYHRRTFKYPGASYIQRSLLLHVTLQSPSQTQPTCVGVPTPCQRNQMDSVPLIIQRRQGHFKRANQTGRVHPGNSKFQRDKMLTSSSDHYSSSSDPSIFCFNSRKGAASTFFALWQNFVHPEKPYASSFFLSLHRRGKTSCLPRCLKCNSNE